MPQSRMKPVQMRNAVLYRFFPGGRESTGQKLHKVNQYCLSLVKSAADSEDVVDVNNKKRSHAFLVPTITIEERGDFIQLKYVLRRAPSTGRIPE